MSLKHEAETWTGEWDSGEPGPFEQRVQELIDLHRSPLALAMALAVMEIRMKAVRDYWNADSSTVGHAELWRRADAAVRLGN
jgi:hypothetical protein